MSLTSLIRDPELLEHLARLRPALPRKLDAPIVAPARSRRFGLVGTAFDYLLRFELQRRAEGAVGRHWVAEHAPRVLRCAADGTVEVKVVFGEGPPQLAPPPGGFRRAAKRVEAVLEAARFAVADYVIASVPPAASLAALATHALRVARLDLVYRTRIFDTRVSEAAPEDVEDLVALLEVVPFGTLLPPGSKHVLLNPLFGDSPLRGGGPDTDLIIGDQLVDVKVSQEPRIRVDQLDQLLGYYFLARRARRSDASFPRIRSAALYFARRAYVCRVDVNEWTAHPAFPATEELFFRRAADLFERG